LGERAEAECYSGLAMGILELFGINRKDPWEERHETPSDTVRKITAQLNEMDREQAKYIASFAYVLGRVAHADLDISDEETGEMERIVQGLGGLPEEQAILVVQLAKTQALLFSGTENFVVTQEFNRIASREQKIALLNCLYAVSASDQSISAAEDNEIRRITQELRLDHEDFIAARSAYRDDLEVLKKPAKDAKS
jgi:uncharacterized tellurite resistance protein B-like protein